MGTNYFDALLASVEPDELRQSLIAEVDKLRDNKEFGLVYESHAGPEFVRLLDHPIRAGRKVQIKSEKGGDSYTVVRTDDSESVLRSSEGDYQQMDNSELVVISNHGEPIFPGLTEVSRIERGGDKPFHIVVNSDNYHALQLLMYTHEGKVDCIYIDPPYNTGAKDWKYNNAYVDLEDRYRHSKWLSFIEKRLDIAKHLLNPNDSTLIIAIDKNELFTLGLLLRQKFPNSEIQILTMRISPRGKSRVGKISQVDEYLMIVYFGNSIVGEVFDGSGPTEIRWRYLRREDIESARGTKKGGPRQFYPIYVSTKTGRIEQIGEPLDHGVDRTTAPSIDGCAAVFPVNEENIEFNWGLTKGSLQSALDDGFVKVTKGTHEYQSYTIAYLSANNISKLNAGILEISGTRSDGSNIVIDPRGKAFRPTTMWADSKYDAGKYGTSINGKLMPGRKFPFAKSLYSVEDILRLFVGHKPKSVVLDFFAGSGTTSHAIFRLNKQDGGVRQSILVTNNEVSYEEEEELRKRGLNESDDEWKSLGIFHHLTVPRITAAVTGKTHLSHSVEGDYDFTDIFPMRDGFNENIRFFDLQHISNDGVSRAQEYNSIAPIIWMNAGSRGSIIAMANEPYVVQEEQNYAILFDVSHYVDFVKTLDKQEDIVSVFIVTDSRAQFQQIVNHLPSHVDATMLYEDYLRNFQIGA